MDAPAALAPTPRFRWFGAGLGLLGVLLMGCFEGDFLAGRPCEADADCGRNLVCVDGLCSGTLCGNGIVEPSERCDEAGDSPECDGDCTPVVCGDGYANQRAGELCDGTDLAGVDCTLLGWFGGTLVCRADCTFDVRNCDGCMSDAVCSGAAPVCNVYTHECRICYADDECEDLASTPVCDSSTGACVGCVGDSDCAGSSVCDHSTQRCVGCLVDAQCSGPTPVCDPVGKECVGCVLDAHCALDPRGHKCDPVGQTCVECTSSIDCEGSKPYCDQIWNACFECTSGADCSDDAPYCKLSTRTCEVCLIDEHCVDDPDGSECSSVSNTCMHAPCDDPGGCEECSDTKPCVGSHAPFCDLVSRSCVGCLNDDHCSAPTPACDPSSWTCVECTDDGHCTNSKSSVCDDSAQVCLGCLDDLDCAVGQRCELSTNACISYCHDDGDCDGIEVCDPAASTCVVPACGGAGDCPPGSSDCVGDQCMPTPCGSSIDCPDDSSTCGPQDLCTPGPGSQCEGSLQCGGASYGCADGFCVQCQDPGDRCARCAHDPATCDASHVCNPAIDACVECAQDADCSKGEQCQPTGECAIACSGAGSCPAGFRCDQYNRCSQDRYGDECRGDGDCPGGQCVQGLCVDCILDGAECRPCIQGDAASECGAGMWCDLDLLVCVECRDNEDCPGETPVCNFGVCQPACLGDLDCAGIGATCNPGSKACELPPAPPCAVDAQCEGFGTGSEVECLAGVCGYP